MKTQWTAWTPGTEKNAATAGTKTKAEASGDSNDIPHDQEANPYTLLSTVDETN